MGGEAGKDKLWREVEVDTGVTGPRLTFVTFRVRFTLTRNESLEPVEETVWTRRIANARTSSP
jgi:hypothetical protein